MRLPWTAKDTHREPEDAPPVLGNSWTMGDRLAAGGTTALLWIAILCGPAGLMLSAWQLTQPAPVPKATASVDAVSASARQRAEEFAVRAVTTWLSAARGQEDLVRALLPQASSITLPADGLRVADAMVAESHAAGPDIWTVTVAVTVTDQRMVSRRFFELPVRVQGQTVAAVSLPGEVPASLLAGSSPDLDYRVLVPSGSPLFTTASEFLGAFLAGQGDVARVISPDASIRAVAPAPYTQVSVTGIAAHSDVPSTPGDGDELDVLVTASAASGDHQAVTVQYPLTLAVRAGRWEIATIRDMPLTSAKQPQTSATPTQAPVETLTPSPTPTTPSATPTQQ